MSAQPGKCYIEESYLDQLAISASGHLYSCYTRYLGMDKGIVDHIIS